MIKISVIVPCYNMEAHIENCIESIRKQDMDDIEIICINDGSTDRTREWIERFMQSVPYLKLINQDNQGVGVARNNGIISASGKYVVFMDADDYYPDERVLRDLYQGISDNDALICGGGFIENHGSFIRTEYEGIYQKYVFDQDGFIEYKDYQFDYGYHRFIYDREFLIENQITFPSYVRFQDPPFMVKAMITAKRFYALKRFTYGYWDHGEEMIWTEKKVNGLLKGLVDNLKLSADNQLQELHQITAWRLLEEFKTPIAECLANGDFEVSDLLLRADKWIQSECLSDELFREHGVGILFFHANDILREKQRIEMEKQRRELLAEKEREIVRRDELLTSMTKQYEDVISSKSYRVGNTIMKVPILVKRKFDK